MLFGINTLRLGHIKLATSSLIWCLAFALVPLEGYSQDHSFAASQLSVKSIFASRANESVTYVFLGSGFLRSLRSDDADHLIAQWLAKHPKAVVTPVSTMPIKGRDRLVYAWMNDGEENLQTSLVRQGALPGGTMVDFVENLAALRNLIPNREQEIKPPVRLVSDAQYAEFIARVIEAERAAKNEKAGIWSDKLREVREQEGIE